jgi:hypothetical protein
MSKYYIINIDNFYDNKVFYVRDMLSQIGIQYTRPENTSLPIEIMVGGNKIEIPQHLYSYGNDNIVITDTEMCVMRKMYIDDLKRSVECKEFDSFPILFRWLKIKQLLKK